MSRSPKAVVLGLMPSASSSVTGDGAPSVVPTAAQLKSEIVNGRTGEPISGGDVGAAPLGTCDEAGGAPPKSRELWLAGMREASSRRRRGVVGASDHRDFAVPIYGFVIGGIACVLCAAMLFI